MYSTNGVVEKKMDKFKNELIINSFHCCEKGECFSPHYPWFPIDVIYKSNQDGEKVYMAYGGVYLTSESSLIVNIDGKKNIELKKSFDEDIDFEQVWVNFSSKDYKWHEEWYSLFETDNTNLSRTYFEMTKEQFLQCCQASSLAVQVRENKNTVCFEKDNANGFIPILRVIYNEAIDHSMFVDELNSIISKTKRKQKQNAEEIKQEKVKDSFSTILFIILFLGVSIGLGFLLIAIM